MGSTQLSASRLARAVGAAHQRMKPYRRNRAMFLRQYAGGHYASMRPGAMATVLGPQPLNMIHSLVSVVLPHLVAGSPRALIGTPRPDLRPQAEVFSLAWNHLARQIDLARALRTVVIDALFGAGIMKTGLGPSPSAAAGADDMSAGARDNGQAFADPVDLDDYVIDPNARCREQASFEGNRYRLPLEYVLDCGLYDRKLASKLLPAPAGGSPDGPDRPGTTDEDDDWARCVELVDLWLPRENLVVTLAANDDAPAGFLRQIPWNGPQRGPYEMLGFHWIPQDVLPVPPVALIFDLHVMINKIARKLARQADRQKDLVLFDQRAAEEAQAVRDAGDGEMVAVQNVDRYRQISLGGANEEGYKHIAFLFEQFNRIGGNVDLLGGVSPQSDTLGQDEMLFANATVRIEDMRSQVYEFTKHVGAKLAWYLWYDPLVNLPLAKVSACGDSTPVRFSAEELQGDFLDYHFDVEPYSMSPDSPSGRYRRTMEWVNHVVLPTAQLGAAQGTALDVAKLARLTGRMLNIPDAQDLYGRGAPMSVPPIKTPADNGVPKT